MRLAPDALGRVGLYAKTVFVAVDDADYTVEDPLQGCGRDLRKGDVKVANPAR